MHKFDTHKFLYTLFYEGKIEGHEVVFLDRENKEKKIKLKKIEISASPVSCKLFDEEGNRYFVPFIRIRKVFFKGEMVWDNTDVDLSDVKIIKGHQDFKC